jgi:hypothetical protein
MSRIKTVLTGERGALQTAPKPLQASQPLQGVDPQNWLGFLTLEQRLEAVAEIFADIALYVLESAEESINSEAIASTSI